MDVTDADTIATLREHLASAREMVRYWREAATRDERSARALSDLKHAGIARVYL